MKIIMFIGGRNTSHFLKKIDAKGVNITIGMKNNELTVILIYNT
jgi:hypothetical protein